MVFPLDPPEETFQVFLIYQFSHTVHAIFQCQTFQLLFRLLLDLPDRPFSFLVRSKCASPIPIDAAYRHASSKQ